MTEDAKAFLAAIVIAVAVGGSASISEWRGLFSLNNVDWPAWLQAIAAIGGTLVAWVLYKLTRYQVEILKRQTTILDRQTALSVNINRAFVSVKEFRWEWLHATDDTSKIIAWRFTPILENSGNSPARRCVSFVSWLSYSSNLPANFDYQDIGGNGTLHPALIRAHGTIGGQYIEVCVPLLSEVKAKTRDVLIWGWAEYSDNLDITDTKRLEFCNKIIVHGDPNERDCNFAWPFHTQHNGDDMDCYRNVGERAHVENASFFQ